MCKVQLNAYILSLLILATAAGTKLARPPSMQGMPRTDFKKVPVSFDGWIGEDKGFGSKTQRALPSASLLYRSYQRDYDLVPVGLGIVYGTDLGDFHQPEICLEGQGLKSASKGTVRIKDGNGGTFEAVSLITETDYQRQAFVFWFYTEGMSSTSLGSYKLRILRNRLLNRQVHASAMIRMDTLVTDTDEEAVARIVQFANAAVPYLRFEFDSRKTEGQK